LTTRAPPTMPPKTIAKGKGKGKAVKAKTAAPNGAAGASPKEATEALKWLMMMGAGEEAVAHRVAAIMTGKTSTAKIDVGRLAMSALRLVCVMPDDIDQIKAKVAQNANVEVQEKLAVVAGVARSLGPAAFIKLIPTQNDLHRHVAVLLPQYDSKYTYTQGDASSSLKGPDGLKWKTRRTPDEDNDPRFPDFW